MTIYTALALLVSFGYLIMILYLLLINEIRNKLHRRLLVCCFSFFWWGFCYIFVYSSKDINVVEMAYKLSSIAWLTLPVSMGLCYEVYILGEKTKKAMYLFYLLPLIFLPSVWSLELLTTGFDLTGNTNIEIASKGSILGLGFNLYFILSLGILLTIVGVFGYRQDKNRISSQVKVIILFGGTSFVFGVVDFFFFGSQNGRPSLVPVVTGIYGFGLWYAIIRYDIFINYTQIMAGIIVNHIQDFVMVTDEKEHILEMNKPLMDVLGYTLVEGHPKASQFFSSNVVLTEDMYKELDEDEILEVKRTNLVSIKGIPIPVSIRGSVVKDRYDDTVGYLFIMKNLQIEEELSQNFEIVNSLVSSIEIKDKYTEGHAKRVQEYSVAIARKLDFSIQEVHVISMAALLHDVGKIGINEDILNKKGRLDDHEFEIIKQHPAFSKKVLRNISNFDEVIEVAYYHHERYDGAGYPEGLKGDRIPLAARIVQIADAYDAMTSSRSYRKAMPKEKALRIIKEESGKQFDPQIVEIFLEIV